MFVQRYRRRLKARLNSRGCKEAFERLKTEHSIFDLCPTVESLCNLFRPSSKNYVHKDEVMAIFLTELHRSIAIYPLINIMFWDSLHSLYCQRRSRVIDQEELFARIQVEFYHSLINHNLKRLPKKIDVNIFLNTKMKVIVWEKENLRDKEFFEKREHFQRVGLSPFDLWKSKIYPEEMEEYLLDKVYQKIITEIQCDLILETQVHKRMNQRGWAKKSGILYNTARTLMRRAKMAMRYYEEERKLNFFATKTAFDNALYMGANINVDGGERHEKSQLAQ